MASLGGEKKKEIKRKPHRFQKPFWLLKVRRGKKKKEKELFQVKAGNCSRAMPCWKRI